jgi:hypothetical protein
MNDADRNRIVQGLMPHNHEIPNTPPTTSERKAELWDYYCELVKSHGYEGFTDLLNKANAAREIPDAIGYMRGNAVAALSQGLTVECFPEQDDDTPVSVYFRLNRQPASNEVGGDDLRQRMES